MGYMDPAATSSSFPYPGENIFAPSVSSDPVRKNLPFTPEQGTVGPSPAHINLMGVLGIVVAIALFEHFRKGR